MKVKIKTLAWKQLSHSAWLAILPCSFSDVFVCNLWFLLIGRVRAVSAALHTPQLGGAHAVTGAQNSAAATGPKIQSRHHLAPKENFDPPN